MNSTRKRFQKLLGSFIRFHLDCKIENQGNSQLLQNKTTLYKLYFRLQLEDFLREKLFNSFLHYQSTSKDSTSFLLAISIYLLQASTGDWPHNKASLHVLKIFSTRMYTSRLNYLFNLRKFSTQYSHFRFLLILFDGLLAFRRFAGNE